MSSGNGTPIFSENSLIVILLSIYISAFLTRFAEVVAIFCTLGTICMGVECTVVGCVLCD
jgi:hypothetical protein